MPRREDLNSPTFVRELFDGMAATYGITNVVSSFGFCRRWRRQCVELAAPKPDSTVYDLMSGMGECWPLISASQGGAGAIVAVDFSSEMCSRAARTRAKLRHARIDVLEQDVLDNDIPDASADCVVSSFGLKTFSSAQRRSLAREIARILRPGGSFCLLEISVPRLWALRVPYMLYLEWCIPVLGTLFLGNPTNYRMLGVYTAAFGDCRETGAHLREAGLQVETHDLFFGCATALSGTRPA